MSMNPFEVSDDSPVYVISVAAELSACVRMTGWGWYPRAARPAAAGGTRCVTS